MELNIRILGKMVEGRIIIICFINVVFVFVFFSSRRRHTRFDCDWSSDVCSSDLVAADAARGPPLAPAAARGARRTDGSGLRTFRTAAPAGERPRPGSGGRRSGHDVPGDRKSVV